jgi:hypothetical protein
MSEIINNKDTTIKCTNEQKDAINQLTSELGANATQKDAMDHLLRLSRMRKEEESGRTIPRLDDLRYLFTRFEGIYSEMYLSMRDQEQLSQETIEIRISEAGEMKARLFEMGEQLQKVQEQTAIQIDEMAESVRRTIDEKEIEVNKVKGEAALVREAADKELQQMLLLVKESHESKEQSSRLVTMAQEMAESAKQKAESNENQAKKAIQFEEETQKLRSEMDRLKNDNEKREQEHIREIEKLESNSQLEKERAALDIEKKMMEQHSIIREQAATLREQIAEMKIELERSGKDTR